MLLLLVKIKKKDENHTVKNGSKIDPVKIEYNRMPILGEAMGLETNQLSSREVLRITACKNQPMPTLLPETSLIDVQLFILHIISPPQYSDIIKINYVIVLSEPSVVSGALGV